MLKLFLYGYLNGISSSRKLEAETHRNIELKWLSSRCRFASYDSKRRQFDTFSKFFELLQFSFRHELFIKSLCMKLLTQ